MFIGNTWRNLEMKSLNRKRKNGSWILTGAYLKYRNEGGRLSPLAWNNRIKEINASNLSQLFDKLFESSTDSKQTTTEHCAKCAR